MKTSTRDQKTNALPEKEETKTASRRMSASKPTAKRPKETNSPIIRLPNRGDAAPTPDREQEIRDLRKRAKPLINKHAKTNKQALEQAIELGLIFNKLKNLVTHGSFMPTVVEWVGTHGANISHRTATNYMEYARLDEESKLASASNLADAEEIRKDEGRHSPTDGCPTKEESKKEKEPKLKPLPPAKLKREAYRIARIILVACEQFAEESREELRDAVIEALCKGGAA